MTKPKLKDVVDKDNGLKVWTNGEYITESGEIYYKVMFLINPIQTVDARGNSRGMPRDGVSFQCSLTKEQVLELPNQVEKLLKGLGLKQ